MSITQLHVLLRNSLRLVLSIIADANLAIDTRARWPDSEFLHRQFGFARRHLYTQSLTTELLDEDMKANLGAYVNDQEDEDRSWNDLQNFIRENQTFKIKSSARAKPPSLAQCMARAGVDNADLDLDSDSEDDEIDLSQKI